MGELVLNRLIKFVSLIGFALCFSSQAHSQCWEAFIRDCATGTNVACGGGECDLFSQNPATGDWWLGIYPPWKVMEKCREPGTGKLRPNAITHSNQVNLTDMTYQGDGYGPAATIGPLVDCVQKGACNCDDIGVLHPCATGPMGPVAAYQIQTWVLSTEYYYCIEN